MAKKKESELLVLVLFEKSSIRVLRYPEDAEDREDLMYQIFSERDDQGYYDDTESMSEKMLGLLDKACKGDKAAAQVFLNLRGGQGVKGEMFQFFTVE